MKKTAINIVKRAGEIALKRFRSDSKEIIEEKKHDLIIKTDKILEKEIINMLEEEFPNYSILSEEREEIRKGDPKWIVDPLDGSVNFSFGLPEFCISLALEKNKEIVLGIIYAPYLDELFYAKKGKGAFFNNKPIQVSNRNLNESIVAGGFGFTKKDISDSADIFKKIGFRCKKTRSIGSEALALCNVAAGWFDAYLAFRARPWDIAAGALIVEEARGRITDLNNKNWTPYIKNILATNKKIHEDLIKLL